MATKKFFFGHGSFLIRDGSEIRFWEDKWLGNTSLREQYPALYAIVCNKGDTLSPMCSGLIAQTWRSEGLYLSLD
jgi:hypothetical protein